PRRSRTECPACCARTWREPQGTRPRQTEGPTVPLRERGSCTTGHARGSGSSPLLFATVKRKLAEESTSAAPAHAALAVVLQVRKRVLQVLLWERARDPYAGRWALPGGYLEPGETLESSIRRHLAEKVDVRELSHLEQL